MVLSYAVLTFEKEMYGGCMNNISSFLFSFKVEHLAIPRLHILTFLTMPHMDRILP